MTFRIKVLKLFFFFIVPGFLAGQSNIRDSTVFAPLLGISYSIQVPGGDLNDNYGINSNLGGNFLLKTKKNWIGGIEGNFLFGNNVKDTAILDHLKTSGGKGFIITVNGDSARVYIYERGYALFGRVGKLIPFKKPNPNSGILVTTGIGFLQHKKRIEVTGDLVPELKSDYRKGYDRLTNGIAISQFIGYQYLSNRRLINFFAGIECTLAFTKNRRGYNYDTMQYDVKSRRDILYGLRAGWILPLYKKTPKDFYFN